ncbi:MAG: hypothetical protein IJN24_08330 [Bacteroidaceae bacterium]|nr:hypothetical protein [Bacteroidaceae bacterium]
MAINNYITAIEIGSSRISGAVGIQTYSGIRILAYAGEPVGGFISKGVVRNIDETSKSLTSLVNRLDDQLKDATIQSAYVAFGGLSMHSIHSTVIRNFNTYTKITEETIKEMALENEALSIVPDGYCKIDVIPLECHLNGETTTTPIGTTTLRIERNYLNIVLREQYMKQMLEAFEMAQIGIIEGVSTAKVGAPLLFEDDETTSGTALIDIGGGTTTVTIFSNNLMKKLAIIPLGSANITKDLCSSGKVSVVEAEQMKIFKGYRSQENNTAPITTEETDRIISARMLEILHNAKHQIETSGVEVGKVILTGGGSKLKNIELLTEKVLSNYKVRLAKGDNWNIEVADNLELSADAITPALLGLLLNGKENCCKEEITAPNEATPQTDLFIKEMPTEIYEKENEEKLEERAKEKPEEKKREEKKKKPSKTNIFFKNLFGAVEDFVDNVTAEEDGDNKPKNDESL